MCVCGMACCRKSLGILLNTLQDGVPKPRKAVTESELLGMQEVAGKSERLPVD